MSKNDNLLPAEIPDEPIKGTGKAWKQVDTEYLWNETWFKLRRDRLVKGNGQEMYPYYVLEYSDWVNVLPVTADGKVILVKQYRYALGAWSIELPGGIMDAGETDPEAAAKRELLEETGYSCGKVELAGIVAANPATHNNRLHCYLATGCTRTHAQHFDEHEDMDVLLVTVDELKTMLQNNEILQSLHVSSILYGLLKLGAIHL